MSCSISRLDAHAGSPAAGRRIRTGLRFLAAVLAALGGLVPSGPARAQCPQSAIGVGCFDIVMESFDASSARYDGASWTAGTPCPYGCFDATAGTMHAENAYEIHSGGCASDVQLVDDFQLVGAPAGPALSFQAVLQVTGSITSTGVIRINLYASANPGGGVDFLTSTPSRAVSGSIVLPLTLAAGQTVRLVAQLEAAGLDAGGYTGGSASADAVLRFGGLPAGVSVTSCRAYDLPVPVHATSWGNLKATYR